MKKIVIFGESHTRSFAHINNVLPVFMDSGKSINLDTKSIKNVESKINTLRKKLPKDDYIFFSFLGEPNVRYQLNNDWYIHKDKNFKYTGDVNEEYLDQCIFNYRKLILKLDFPLYVITPTTAYEPSLKSLKYFNKKLIEVFGDKVVDIFSNTLHKGKVKEEFKDPNFEDDPIHLNSNIVDIFFKQLVSKDIFKADEISNFKKNKKLVYSNHVKEMFNKNRFGTLKLK